MKKLPSWILLETRVHALSARERMILLALIVTLLVGLVDQLWLDKRFKELMVVQGQIQQARQSILLSQEQLVGLAAQRARDPDREVRSELEKLADRKTLLDAEIDQISGQFVSPARMPKVLSTLLESHEGLHLLSVQALPVKEVSMGTGEQSVKLYEHGVKLVFKGSFVALGDYLQAIEALDQSLLWDSVTFSTVVYPVGDIELVVKTLGTGKEFIGVYR